MTRLERLTRLLTLIPDAEIVAHADAAQSCFSQAMELRRTKDTKILQECSLFASLALAAMQDELSARQLSHSTAHVQLHARRSF